MVRYTQYLILLVIYLQSHCYEIYISNKFKHLSNIAFPKKRRELMQGKTFGYLWYLLVIYSDVSQLNN